MGVFRFFTNKSASVELNALLISDSSNWSTSWETTVQSCYQKAYPHVVSFFLEKFVNEKIITEMESASKRLGKSVGVNPLQYAEELVAKTLR